jgi:hypothetical protein
MYKLKYYLSGGTLVSKYFTTLHQAIVFSVYNVGYGNFYGIDKVAR